MTEEFYEKPDRDEVLDQFIAVKDWKGAERFAQSVEELWQRAESLTRLARALAAAGLQPEAKRVRSAAVAVAQEGELSHNPQDSIDSSSVLWELAVDIARSGESELANNVARQIRNTGKRNRALQAVSAL